MFTMPSAPRSIGGVLDDAFKLYRQSFWSVWVLSILGFILGLVAFGLAAWSLIADFVSGDPQAALLAAVTSPSFWLAILLPLAFSLWFYSAQFVRAHRVAEGEPSTLGSALTRGLSITPAVALSTFLYFLMLIVTVLLPIVVSALLPSFWSRLLVGLALCVPFVMLTVMYFFYLPAIVVDDTGPMGGLGRSRELVRGNWWRVVAILTVGFIILMVVYLAAGVLAELMAMPVRDVMGNAIVSTLINSVLTSVVAPLLPALSLATYYDLRVRRFGGDLAQRVDGLA